jgi:hypothetical protein
MLTWRHVRGHLLRPDNVIGVKYYNSTILSGAGRHDDGNTMVLGMNATLNMDESSPKPVGLDNVGRTASEIL